MDVFQHVVENGLLKCSAAASRQLVVSTGDGTELGRSPAAPLVSYRTVSVSESRRAAA